MKTEAVAELVSNAAAASVRMVQVPDSFPSKCDLVDLPPPEADLEANLAAAEPWQQSAEGDKG